MTVSELREKLEALEGRGRGGAEVEVWLGDARLTVSDVRPMTTALAPSDVAVIEVD